MGLSGKTVLKFIETLGIRIVPGVINTITLIYIAKLLGAEDYGLFSTTIATVSFSSIVIFGSVIYSIMPASAKMNASGLEREYTTSVICLLLVVSIAVVVLGTAVSRFGVGSFVETTLVVSFGLHTALQEILRSQLRLWAYGWSAIGQAVAYQAGAMALIAGSSDVSAALAAFSLSYLVGALISFSFLGPTTLRRPRLSYVSGSLMTGYRLVSCNVAENGIFLGVRYALLMLGSQQHLGVFSFCLDLAQRSVGFFMNAASFIFVPRAFVSAAKGDVREFRRGLYEGAAIALLFALGTAVAIISFYFSGYADRWLGKLFDPVVFLIICVAVLLNRTKKVVIDPFAMRSNTVMRLTYSYVAGGLVCCCLAAAGLRGGLPLSPELAFLLGNLVAASCSFFALRHQISDRAPGVTGPASGLATDLEANNA